MSKISSELASIVNASGFLFQLRVADLVASTASQHGWEVQVQEHPWKDRVTGGDGFIDLVAHRSSIRLVIECKRVVEGAWVFLVPNAKGSTTERARVFITTNRKDGHKIGRWEEFYLAPSSNEAGFCVVRGSGENDRPMLERLAAQAAAATEAFGSQELLVERSWSLDVKTLYVPVIVTGANLFVCNVEPGQIDLATGKVDSSNAEFKKVDAVRFRKALTTAVDLSGFADIKSVNRESDRTVFVTSVSTLAEWLRGFSPVW